VSVVIISWLDFWSLLWISSKDIIAWFLISVIKLFSSAERWDKEGIFGDQDLEK